MILTTTLSSAEPAFQHHKVSGRVILPAVGFLELIFLAATQIDGLKRPVVKDLVLMRPLVMDEAECTVRLEVKPDETCWKVEVSRVRGKTIESLVQAKLENLQGDFEAETQVGADRMEALANARTLEAADLYKRLGQVGLDYGPVYRTVQGVEISGDEAASRLRAQPAAGDEAGGRLGMLDGALQTIASLLQDNDLRVPFMFRQIWFGGDLGAAASVRVKAQARGGYEVRIFDAAGKLACLMKGVQLRRLDPEAKLGHYKRTWHPCEAAGPTPGEAPIVGRTLLVCWKGQRDLAAHMAAQLQATQVDILELGHDSVSTDGDVVCMRDDADALSRWAKDVIQPDGGNEVFDLVWFAGFDDASSSSSPQAADDVRCVLALFRLVKALDAHRLCATRARWEIWTRHAFSLHNEVDIDTGAAALLGFCRTMGREYRRWTVRCVDFAPSLQSEPVTSALLMRDAQAVWRRPAKPGVEILIHRHGQFFEEGLRRVDLPVLTEGQDKFRERGSYLIVGGAGGIGFAMSQRLAKEKKANFVWVGRRAQDAEIEDKIQQIEALGGAAMYCQANAADEAAMRGAVHAAERRLGEIHGVIHSALVLKDAAIRNLSEADFLGVLESKVAGCVALTNAFLGKPLDFMVFFSSANSYWGNVTQSNYVAACAFSDAWAARVKRNTGMPVRVINWGFWGSVGVVASDYYRNQMQAAGLGSIEPDEGLAALRQILALPDDVAPPIVVKATDRFLSLAGATSLYKSRVLSEDMASLFEPVMAAVPELPANVPRVERIITVVAAVERFVEQGVLAVWLKQGVRHQEPVDIASARQSWGIAESQYRLFDACWHILERAGLIERRDGKFWLVAPQTDADACWNSWIQATDETAAANFEMAPYFHLAKACIESLVSVLQGRLAGTFLLFSPANQPHVNSVYNDNILANYLNDQVADAVVAAVKAQLSLCEHRPVRILELGAGTGGTTAKVLEALSDYASHLEYVYTDISAVFLRMGRNRFGRRSTYLRFSQLDVERDIEEQGFCLGHYDIVIAANVLHATRTIRHSLESSKRLLRRGGLLIANETTAVTAFTTLTFGMLPGWWVFQDAGDRLPASPLLDMPRWRDVLKATGFPNVQAVPMAAGLEARVPQRAWVAESDGECLSAMKAIELRPAKAEPAASTEDAAPAAQGLPTAGASQALGAVPDAASASLPVHAPEPPAEPVKSAKVEKPAAKAPGQGATRDAIQARLVEIIAGMLGVPDSDIDPGTPYSDFGIDSILAAKLVDKVNDVLQAGLQLTDLFTFTTVEALAEHLHTSSPHIVLDTAQAAHEPMDAPGLPPQEAALQPEPVREQSPAQNPATASSRADVDTIPGADDHSRGHRTPDDDAIAVIGMAGRFPGADDLAAFWDNILAGRETVADVPLTRWDVDKVFDPRREARGKTYCRKAGMLERAYDFDPLFFNLSPLEAATMDPQQRLFLEEAWKALEDACYANTRLDGVSCGVFVGCSGNDYRSELLAHDRYEEAFALTGNSNAILAARISYLLNLRGPSLAVDTACSSSLVALHYACRSIQSGDCDMALAGGVALLPTAAFHVTAARTGMLSPRGHCSAFDEDADGFVPAEGAGVVVLKSLRAALRDGDRIHGVIRANAINQDGRSNGITAPNGQAQTTLAAQAYRRAGISADTISYVEAHGTGTQLGDPIEFDSLTRAFRQSTEDKQFCALGSVKSNIGHALAAAGIAGFLKLLLSLRHGVIPPLAQFKQANRLLQLSESPFFIPVEAQPWQARGGLRRGAMSSFGFSGTNCHLVLEEAPAAQAVAVPHAGAHGALILLSARSGDALQRKAAELLAWMDGAGQAASLGDIAFTLEAGRSHFEHRLAFIARHLGDLRDKLVAYTTQQTRSDIFTGQLEARPDRMSRAFGELGRGLIQALREAPAHPSRNEKLLLLAELFCGGFAPGADLGLAVNAGHWVALPAYPFARTSHRFTASSDAVVVLPASTQAAKTPDAVHATAQTLLFEKTWRPVEWPTNPMAANIRLLVLGQIDEIWETHLLATLSGALVRARRGTGYRKLSDHLFEIDPTNPADYRQLVSTLADSGMSPTHVLWAWGWGPQADLSTATALQLHAPVAWLQACDVRASIKHLMLVSESSAAQEVAAGGLCGLWASTAWENPHWLGESLIVAPGVQPPVESVMACLAAVGRAGRVRRLTHQGLFEQGFNELSAVPAPALLPWRDNGIYVISGGAGRLARLAAERIASQSAAKVVLIGRRDADAEMDRWLAAWPQARYMRCDLGDADAVRDTIATIRSGHGGPIRGILHMAGSLQDGWLASKTPGQLNSVLAGKLSGAVNLDEATAQDPLDFFVAYSSATAVFGNAGQCDYAFANGALDAFMQIRHRRAQADERQGRSLSLNWPYWSDGGMKMDESTRDMVARVFGFMPLPTADGLALLEGLLQSNLPQCLVAHGDPAKIRTALEHGAAPRARPAVRIGAAERAQLQEATERFLVEFLSTHLKMPMDVISVTEELLRYGIDSIVIQKLNATLSAFIGAFPRTLMFEMRTVRDVASYLVEHHGAELQAKFADADADAGHPAAGTALVLVPDMADLPVETMPAVHDERRPPHEHEPIAIIGMAGRYPGADDVQTFWRNLDQGLDSVTEVPGDRWDWREHFDADPEHNRDGKIYARWGAFLSDVDKFDPLFFGISPREAEGMDPQERLFLETAWATFEDAGYSRTELSSRARGNVGVFVGSTSNTYVLHGADAWNKGMPVVPSSLPWSIANRVSYCLDLHGPSIAVDTACSASLSAIHLACQSIRQGECEQALAGGVNLYLHPLKYHGMCHLRMLSASGQCRPFGDGADGFVPGEGVGAVLLKPLSAALRDGDFIYGLVRSTAVNHGGRTNGYTVPSPNSQGDLIRQAFKTAGVDPARLGYVEAHGTGTALGDPVELRGLELAFRNQPLAPRSYAIGSLKANIGHLESAAAIAGLSKVLCQLEHQRIAPSLNAMVPNENVDFERASFRVQHEGAAWPALMSADGTALPRVAALSSFGAGGANGHMVIEEFVDQPCATEAARRSEVFVLSARTEDALTARAADLLACLRAPDLAPRRRQRLTPRNVAYTLQVGREAMDKRIALIADSMEGLMEMLQQVVDGRGDLPHVYRGEVDGAIAALLSDDDGTELVRSLAQHHRLAKLAQLWVKGLSVDWALLHTGQAPVRVPLPAYRFDKRRCWFRLPQASPSGAVLGLGLTDPGNERAPGLLAPPLASPSATTHVPDLMDTQPMADSTGIEYGEI